MGGSITQILNQGKAALAANQSGLATTSHNISNINTEGYSRQRLELKTAEPANLGSNRIGTGVVVGSIARTHSDFIGRRLEEEHTQLGKYQGMSDIYRQLETVFKDDAEQGISKSVSKFFNDVRTLSTQPESVSLRTAVRESAETVTSRFKAVANSVDAVVQDLNRRVEGDVGDINSLSKRIATLNQRIMETEITGASANDERDSRDLAVQKLSQMIEIQVTPLENGGVNILSGRVGVLVNSNESYDLRTVRAPDGPNPGSTHILLNTTADGKGTRDVTDLVDNGSLGGYLKVRDKDIPGLMSKIDNLAYSLASNVNAIHKDSFSRGGKKGNEFFAELGSPANASTRLNLSSTLKNDLTSIATGEVPNAPGDNRALLKIADLQDARIFDGGKSNFTDYAAGMIGSLGVEARAANENMETQKGVVEQLGLLREEVSGVSLDEEAINMLKYQKAFDANAKMIQTADSMLETVLNLKRF